MPGSPVAQGFNPASAALKGRERGDDILVERLAEGARLVRVIEHRGAAHCRWQSGDEVGDAERSVQLDPQHANFRRRSKARDRHSDGGGAGPHDDDDPLGIGGPVILEQLAVAAGERRKPAHHALHHAGRVQVEAIHGLAVLKEHVWVLRGGADDRAIAQLVGDRCLRFVAVDHCPVRRHRFPPLNQGAASGVLRPGDACGVVLQGIEPGGGRRAGCGGEVFAAAAEKSPVPPPVVSNLHRFCEGAQCGVAGTPVAQTVSVPVR